MHAMPRKSFRTTAKVLLAIPATQAARTRRSTSPFPMSVSMTLPETPHTMPPPASCHSSPGNAGDTDRSIVDFQPLQTAVPDVQPGSLPSPAVARERQDWKQLLKSKQNYVLLRKVVGFLHDNRALSSEHPDTARRLRQINAELRADTSHRVLKVILNAVFITIGLLLLLSVLAAIGYTSTGQYCIITINHRLQWFIRFRFVIKPLHKYNIRATAIFPLLFICRPTHFSVAPASAGLACI